MDQLPRGNEGFANNNLFGDSQQYNNYDNLFPTGHDQNPYDASWGINASGYPGQSRASQPSAQPWQQNANHLSTAPPHPGLNGQVPPYARSSHSPSPYVQQSFTNYGAQQQNYPYQRPQYDPTLVPPQYNHGYNNYATTNYHAPTTGTIAPHATFNQSPYAGGDYPMGNTNQSRPIRPSVPEAVDQKALAATMPNGRPAGSFSIIDFDKLAKSTKSERMGNFVNIGNEAHNWDITRAALPTYVPRKSRSELRKIAGNDPRAISKLGKKSAKKEISLTSTTKQLQPNSASGSPTIERIKYEGDSSSDSESSSDDDSDSSRTSDDLIESAPVPPKRPSSPKEATEYDTIKALWRGKRRELKPDSIRKGMRDFWEIVRTIRDRWKADSNALAEAEKKNQENELPLLQSRVKDQRDMLEAACKAALKHGHRDIVEVFSENLSLLYVFYQILLDRFKAEDVNGSLSRTILEIMTLSKTLNEDKINQVHLDKVLPRFAKKGDAKTQGYAKRIISNATETKTSRTESPEKKDASKDSATVAAPGKPEPVAGVKRAASTAGEGGAQKKAATTATKTGSTLSTIKQSAASKKTGATADTAKAPIPAVAKPKSVTAKPSGLFAGLQSASKKPGTSNASKPTTTAASKPPEKTTSTPSAAPKSTFSFAETMANLSKPKEEKSTPKPEKETLHETPEEKAKRLRKESRRSLRVQFKTGEDLVQVRLFHHDPDEEIGHDESQMRDVSDVGGEGRMFKQQHQMMDVDDDEDAAEEEEKLVEFRQPGEVDFSEVDPEERERNFFPYGGGTKRAESAEHAKREYYDANNLAVFYHDPSDIPPSPREPRDPNNGEPVDNKKNFGIPDAKYASRAQQKKTGPSKYFGGGQQPSGLDMSKLPAFFNQQPQQQSAYQPAQQPGGNSSNAISDILASLKQSGAIQQQPPAPPAMGGYGNTFAPPQPTMQPQQPAAQQGGQPDLAAILAQLTQSQQPAAQAPQMGGFNFNQTGMPNMTGYNAQPQAQQQAFDQSGNKGSDAARKQRQNPAQNPYYRTKVCKYWQEGRCQKGDTCSYKHVED